MYIMGRDHKFRPIIGMNMYLLDPKTLGNDAIFKGMDYVSNIVMQKMFIPGQVENWVIIMDLNKQSLS